MVISSRQGQEEWRKAVEEITGVTDYKGDIKVQVVRNA